MFEKVDYLVANYFDNVGEGKSRQELVHYA